MVLNGSALNGTRAGAIWVLIEKGKLQREYYIQNNSLTEKLLLYPPITESEGWGGGEREGEGERERERESILLRFFIGTCTRGPLLCFSRTLQFRYNFQQEDHRYSGGDDGDVVAAGCMRLHCTVAYIAANGNSKADPCTLLRLRQNSSGARPSN